MNRRRLKAQMGGFCFVLPAILVVGLLLLYPVCTSLFYSFTNKHLIKQSFKMVWFANYIAILKDPVFWRSFLTNLIWTATSLVGQLLVGFAAAMALERIRHAQGFFRTVLIIPWA